MTNPPQNKSACCGADMKTFYEEFGLDGKVINPRFDKCLKCGKSCNLSEPKEERPKEKCTCGFGTDKYKIWGNCPIKNHQIKPNKL